MPKQFIPQEVCLKCKGCCRFRELNSVWSPCLLDEEIQELLDKQIPGACVSTDKRLLLIPDPTEEGYLCPFLELSDNKCKIYAFRPLECRAYPFLITLRHKKVFLTVDLNCPYVKEKINTPEFREHARYMTDFLNSPKQLKLLKDNPHILTAYEEAQDIIELDS